MNNPIGVGLWVFGPTPDRFVTSGYRERISLERILEQLTKEVREVEGVELAYPDDINEKNLEKILDIFKEYDLKIPAVGLNIFGNRFWSKGALIAFDEKVREEAIKRGQNLVDLLSTTNIKLINIWPGQDGYDYPFQIDYKKAWGNLIESIKCIAERGDVKISIEYKIKEPRTHLLVSTVGKSLYLVEQVGLPNVGVTIDVGHALMAYENLGESIALLGPKLFYLHLNDNYREWDHDLAFASIHLVEFVEMEYWLRKVEYKGWYTLDIFPYRDDPFEAVKKSVKGIHLVKRIVDKIGMSKIEEMIASGKYLELIYTILSNK